MVAYPGRNKARVDSGAKAVRASLARGWVKRAEATKYDMEGSIDPRLREMGLRNTLLFFPSRGRLQEA